MTEYSWEGFTVDQAVEWLLEPSYPTVRYYTLRRLLDRPADDNDVVVTRQAIMTEGPGDEILARQRP